MNRAYSLITVKSVDSERRTITGTATTPTPDRMGDIVEPLGVSFKNPLPLLLYHDSKQPVGMVTFKKPTAKGVEFTASIPEISEPASLKDRVDTAWASVKAGLLKGVSIGFRSIEQAFNTETNGFRFLKTEVLELSLVAVPAQADATIHTIKSIDRASLTASGAGSLVPSTVPASRESLRVTPMNVSEQLTSEKNALAIKIARFAELMTASDAEGGLDDADRVEFQALEKDMPSLTAKVRNLTALEAAQASMTQPVIESAAMKAAPASSTTRGTVEVKALPKGTLFVRYAMAVAAGKGSISDTLQYAKRFTNTPELVPYIKAVEGQTIEASPGWGSQLVNPNTAATEFVELLNPATIIGRVPGFRTAMFNIPIITQTGGSTFEWVDEAAVKPVGELAFDRTTLTYSKVAGIIVMSDELIKLSDPKAEAIVRQDMIEQCAKFLDEQFIQVGISAGTTSPASITNSVSSPTATGTTAAALLHDLNIALATFDNNADGLVIVTTPALARGISLLLTTLGNRQFPEMTPTGGSLLGYPVIVSASVDSGTVVIFKPSDILLADDGTVRLDSSNQATLDMTGGSSPAFSLWQRNCTAIRAERGIKWQKRRANVVAVIDTAAYAPA